MDTWRAYAMVHSACLAGVVMAFSLAGTANEPHLASTLASASSDERVEKLLTTIRDLKLRQTEPNRVAEAIHELGRLKAAAAVNDLARLLAFRQTWPWESTGGPVDEIHTVTPASRYPAVGALMEIGRPSLPAVVKVIEADGCDSLQGANALEVLRFIFRERPSAAAAYLKEAVQRASTSEGAVRLHKAAEALEMSKR